MNSNPFDATILFEVASLVLDKLVIPSGAIDSFENRKMIDTLIQCWSFRLFIYHWPLKLFAVQNVFISVPNTQNTQCKPFWTSVCIETR